MDPAYHSWKDLLINFTETTTCHGVRYISLDAKWFKFLRRMCWVVVVTAAFGVFFYLVGTKLKTYYHYGVDVNVEVRYAESMEFPAITVCNENHFKLTSLQDLGLYDVIKVMISHEYHNSALQVLGANSYNNDSYYFLDGVCQIPDNVTWQKEIKLMTRESCASLCSSIYNYICSSILFDQRTQHCLLSSYIGSQCRHGCNCNPNGSEEFYIRMRAPVSSDITCTFEQGTACPFIIQNIIDQKEDVWEVVEAKYNTPSEDLTLELPVGHYLLFAETARKPGYIANFRSPFLNTTGNCLCFYFRFLGSNTSSITVFVRNREFRETRLSRISSSEPRIYEKTISAFGGKHYMQKLPSGEYQVIIQAERNKEAVPTGAVIDNLSINQCGVAECLRTMTGVDYVGRKSRTASNKQCLAWTDPLTQKAYYVTKDMFPDLYLSDVKNYCRNPLGSRSDKPFCFYIKNNNLVSELCDIPYCDCHPGEFKCDSGYCIPSNLICDGINNCGDNSDELSVCGELRRISCDFEHPYLCGYQTNVASSINHWTYHRNGMTAVRDDPNTDRRDNSLGYYLYLDNRNVLQGEHSIISSPAQTLSGKTRIKFYAYTSFHAIELYGKITAYLLNSLGKRIETLIEVTRSTIKTVYNSVTNTTTYQGIIWKPFDICIDLPREEYSIEFEGTFGEKSITVLALDDVQVESIDNFDGCTYVKNLTSEKTLETCTFAFGDTCHYSQQSFSYWTKWKSLPAQFAREAFILNLRSAWSAYVPSEEQCTATYNLLVCDVELFDTEGHIMSPGFPGSYLVNKIINYNIHTSVSSTIDVVSQYFDTEKGYDYVYGIKHNGTVSTEISTWNGYHGINPLRISTEATTLTLKFKSDFSVVRTGFSFRYSVAKEPGQDYILGLSNRLQTLDNLQSPLYVDLDFPAVMSYTSTNCLTFKLIAATKITVMLKFSNYSEKIDQIDYIPIWKMYSYEISGKSSPYMPRLRADTILNGKLFLTYMAFLDNVTLHNAACSSDTGDSNMDSVSCSFEKGKCGYKNKKEAVRVQSLWELVNTASLEQSFFVNANNIINNMTGDSVILTAFIPGEYGMPSASLISPTFSVQGDSCIQVNVQCPTHFTFLFSTTKYYLNMEASDVDNTLLNNCTTGTWLTLYSSVQTGIHAVEFNVLVSSNQRQFQFEYFAIGNITIIESNCSNTNNNAGIDNEWINVTSTNDSSQQNKLLFEMFSYPESEELLNLGPQLGNIGIMIKNISNLSMEYLSDILAHNISDMLMTCEWNLLACNQTNFHKTYTELGLCYTFNSKGSFPRTKETGSGTGLKILLNAEQYQHIPGSLENGGFKLFLHDPTEVAYIKYLGSAVPTGMHSLLPITMEQFDRLSGNYGNCTKEEEPLFPGQPYSMYRCRESCRFRKVQSLCGCRDLSLPRGMKVCNLAQHIHCDYVLNEFQKYNVTPPCSCFVDCKSTKYSTKLSFGRLSELDPSSYLYGRQNEVLTNFYQATEYRNRMNPNMLGGFLQPFSKLLFHYAQLIQHIEFQISGKGDSLQVLEVNVLKKIQQNAIKEIKDKLLKDVPNLQQSYKSQTEPFLNNIFNLLESLYHNIYRIYSTKIASVDYLPIGNKYMLRISDLLNSTLTIISECRDILNMIKDNHNADNRFSINLLVNNATFVPYKLFESSVQCTHNHEWLNIDNMLTELSEIETAVKKSNSKFQEFLNGSTGSESEIVSSLDEIFNLAKNQTGHYFKTFKDRCLLEYSRFLKNATDVLNSIQLNKLKVDMSAILRVLNEVKQNYTFAYNIYHKYTSNDISKGDVASKLSIDVIATMTQNVDSMNNAMDTYLFQLLKAHEDRVQKQLLSWYDTSLKYAVKLGDYWKGDSDYFQSEAQKIQMWYKPKPNLQVDSLIVQEQDNIFNSWPKNVKMAQFVANIAQFQLESRLNYFFDHLSRTSVNLQTQLSGIISDVKYSSSVLNTELLRFLTSEKIDGNFIKNNFALVNVFYSQPKYSIVKEDVAYDSTSFFSDVGGYMGLLIGMSVITLVEILDLFLYGTAVKLVSAVNLTSNTKKIASAWD